MEYKESEQLPLIVYEDPTSYYVMFHKIIGDSIFKTKHAGNIIALYYFYCHTAKWQKTNRIKATTSYCMEALDIGAPNFQYAKNKLIELGLIKNIKKGNGGGWYIQIMHIPTSSSIETELNLRTEDSKNLENKELRKLSTNALSDNNKNALINNNKKNKQKKKLKRTKQPSTTNKKLPDFYQDFKFFTGEFVEIWFEEFIPLKKRKKASITERALKTQLKKISEYSNDDYDIALEILWKSCNAGWPDIYPIKDFTNKKPVNNSGSHAIPTLKRQKFSSGRQIYDPSEI